MKKRFLSVCLALVLMLSAIPVGHAVEQGIAPHGTATLLVSHENTAGSTHKIQATIRTVAIESLSLYIYLYKDGSFYDSASGSKTDRSLTVTMQKSLGKGSYTAKVYGYGDTDSPYKEISFRVS